jgi:hypothetical protein
LAASLGLASKGRENVGMEAGGRKVIESKVFFVSWKMSFFLK